MWCKGQRLCQQLRSHPWRDVFQIDRMNNTSTRACNRDSALCMDAGLAACKCDCLCHPDWHSDSAKASGRRVGWRMSNVHTWEASMSFLFASVGAKSAGKTTAFYSRIFDSRHISRGLWITSVKCGVATEHWLDQPFSWKDGWLYQPFRWNGAHLEWYGWISHAQLCSY